MLSLCLLSLQSLPQEQDALERLLLSLPFGATEQNRLQGIKNGTVFLQSLGGRLALQALIEQRGLTDSPILCKNEHGKPFFSDSRLPPFSISHSGSLAAALLGAPNGGSVGLDVEFVRSDLPAEKIAHRFFDKEEWTAVSKSPDKNDTFCLLWTKKEAISKLCGKGLSVCIGAAPTSLAHTKSFRAAIGDRIAYVTIACDSPIEEIDIHYYADQKTAILHELPN